MIGLGFDRYCSEIVVQAELLGAAIDGADMTVRVPSCPDWNIGQLIRHLGGGFKTLGNAQAHLLFHFFQLFRRYGRCDDSLDFRPHDLFNRRRILAIEHRRTQPHRSAILQFPCHGIGRNAKRIVGGDQ